MSMLYEQFQWASPAPGLYPPARERWHGTIEDAVNELGILATTKDYVGPSDEALWQEWDETVWHPTRIVAAVVKATQATRQPRLQAMSELTDFTKKLFRGDADLTDVERVSTITHDFGIARENGHLLIDNRTLKTTNVDFSRRAVERLHQKTRDQEPFMIPLCNGGFTSGILTSLEYQKLTGKELPMYPLRFSMYKCAESIPFITPEETAHLEHETTDKTIVVYDEDTTSGETIGTAVSHFNQLFPGREIIGLACSDNRYKYNNLQAQGQWWEKC